MDYETRTLKISVTPKGEPIFSNQATTIEIIDEAGGEYLEVYQCNGDEGKIGITSEEWPMLKEAIEKMLKECR